MDSNLHRESKSLGDICFIACVCVCVCVCVYVYGCICMYIYTPAPDSHTSPEKN